MITEDVLGFTNEYLVTFFLGGKLFERRFVFEPNTISIENVVEIASAHSEGVIAK
jgi:hypothetical protein